jgi:putative CocE/NonD family hydrolase
LAGLSSPSPAPDPDGSVASTHQGTSWRSLLVSTSLARAMRLPAATSRHVEVERDVAIAMDDGVELLADVYTPVVEPPAATILVRTPYGRGRTIGLVYGRLFAERGFRVVLQSCRGTFGSGGTFTPQIDERRDGLATIRWIEAQPWFDGRLAMNGPSYMGYAQWAVAPEAGPSLLAVCPAVSTSDLASHWYQSNSYSLSDALEWTALIAMQESQRYPMLDTLLSRHGRRAQRHSHHLPLESLDEKVVGREVWFWREFLAYAERRRDPSQPVDPATAAPDLSGVTAAVAMVSGWYDIFLPAQLDDYKALVAAGNQPQLTIGPWTHAHPELNSVAAQESLQWIRAKVAGEPVALRTQPVRILVMGADEWRDEPSWPPPGFEPQRWHLQAAGGLAPAPPAEDAGAPESRFRYDPADPTPLVGGPTLTNGGRRNQRTTESRPDVLSFTGEVLDADVEVIGEVTAEIYVASDLPHFDIFVRLCDVTSRDRSYNVTDGLSRISPEQPAGLLESPDGDGSSLVCRVDVTLWPTAYRFRAGHRIRLQVTGGAHPRFARNLGTGDPLGTGVTMRVANQVVHHSAGWPSALVLPVRQSSGA